MCVCVRVLNGSFVLWCVWFMSACAFCVEFRVRDFLSVFKINNCALGRFSESILWNFNKLFVRYHPLLRLEEIFNRNKEREREKRRKLKLKLGV